MKYEEALRYIESTTQYGIKPGFDRITELLRRLGNPQERLKCVHIAGTNGKGSTCGFIESALRVGGYVTGKYTSPAVFDYREKIQVLGKFIKKELVAEYVWLIRELIKEMINDGFQHPTAYEIETAMAFLHFAKEGCDIVILETGLGGRLDATNVINNTICSVITSISFDHEHILGGTLRKIAYEKAGIIKPNSSVILYEQQIEVEDIIYKKAKEVKSSICKTNFQEIKDIEYNIEGSVFSYKNISRITIHLLGEHQIKNAVTAIETVLQLIKLGYKINEKDIKEGLSQTVWQGRFEIINYNPMFIVDGAHNRHAARALSDVIKKYLTNKRIIYIVGVLKDKDYIGIIEETAGIADTVITIKPDNLRGLESKELMNTVYRYYNNVIDAKNIKEGIKIALDLASLPESMSNTAIVAFGSLSYLKQVKELIKPTHEAITETFE